MAPQLQIQRQLSELAAAPVREAQASRGARLRRGLRLRRRLLEPGALTRGELMRLVGVVLNLSGAAYAWAYAAMFAAPDAGWHVAGCGAVFAIAGIALWFLPPWPVFATTSALLATGVISLILTVDEPTATVPLFYLWPLVALAYFHSPKMLAVSVGWMAASLAPVLLIGTPPADQVTYIGAVSIVTLLAILIGLIRRDEAALRRTLELSSSTDSLTGLLNRRAFVPAYEAALAHAMDRGDGLSLVLIDLDHFKRYNDSHGHVTGDAALRHTAAILGAVTGEGDLVARLGGEEFAVVLPGRGPAAAQRWCDRVAAALGPTLAVVPPDHMARAGIRASLSAQLRAVAAGENAAAVRGAQFAEVSHATLSAGERSAAAPMASTLRIASSSDAAASVSPDVARSTAVPPITSSFGIVHVSPSEKRDPDAVFGRADAALYAAKHGGRDRVAIWTGRGAIVGSAMHVDGELAVGAPPLAVGGPAAGTVPDAAAVRARRARMMLYITASMLVTGAINSVARAALMPSSNTEQLTLYAIALMLIGVAIGLTLGAGKLHYRPIEGVLGITAISAVIVTVAPPITATFFYAFPIAMSAYFARPRAVAGVVAWLVVTLVAGLALTHQPVNEFGLLAGVLTNMFVLSSVITGLRWREGRLTARLEAAAAIDPLTGSRTRRAFIPDVEGWIADGPDVALLLIDLDHFKRYNDRHGHLAGDQALRRVAAALAAAVPSDGLVCRFGGEEFAIAFATGGMPRARRCADDIAAQLAVRAPDLTTSIGIAIAQRGETDLDRVVARADQALYAAKGAGRARVAWFASDSDEPLVVTEPIHVAQPTAFDGGEPHVGVSSAA